MLSPDQSFPVLFLTRRDVALLFNDCIKENKLDITIFQVFDEDLPGTVCQELANEWGELYNKYPDRNDMATAQRAAVLKVLLNNYARYTDDNDHGW